MMNANGSSSVAGRKVFQSEPESLEHELHAELNVTRVVTLRGHKAESSCVARIKPYSVSEIGMVEGVDGLSTELQLLVLANPDVL